MRITFVGHASILVETRGITILSDPWWTGPCFGVQWWNYPKASTASLEGKRIDYVYVSHGHHDHLHIGTLKTLPRQAQVLISAAHDLAPSIREAGFEVKELPPDAEFSLTEQVKIRLVPTYGDDTMLAIDDGEQVCINLNDALHSASDEVQQQFFRLLHTWYPRIDYLFCGYGGASHFPNCYLIPDKDAVATAAGRQRYFNGRWAGIVAALEPRFAFPFAADVVFLEQELFWSNEPTHNSERPVDALERLHASFKGTAIDIAPGFQIEDGTILIDRRRGLLSAEQLRKDYAVEIARTNNYGAVEWAEVEQVAALLEKNALQLRDYLAAFDFDYYCVLCFRNSTAGVSVRNTGGIVEVKPVRDAVSEQQGADVVFTTRLPYLRRSLTTPYGHEILFVGSGGVFKYAARGQIRRGIHRELMMLLRQHEHIPVRAPLHKGRLLRSVKHAIKKVLGREQLDLYDLKLWTAFNR